MLLNLRDITVRYTDQPVLDAINFKIEAGERVTLVGRNGAGKSTLLKVIAGDITPDSGEIDHAERLTISQLPQDIPQSVAGSVRDVVMGGLGKIGDQLLEYQALQLSGDNSDRIEQLQHELDERSAWSLGSDVDALLSKMELPSEMAFDRLSGGLKRRALLARALAAKPDLLLLDEPTNHLDIESIDWLERFLKELSCTLVFITHDRAFLDKIATRIAEVDRGKVLNWPGRFADYRRRKTEALEEERRQNAEFDKKLAEEEDWIRRGVKARTKRNQGRVKNLEELREIRGERRKWQNRAQLRAQEGEISSRRVIQTKAVTISIGGQVITRNLNLKIQRGHCIGIMGPNGCGKTTLLRSLMHEHEADTGTIKHGENLEVAYFDQSRSQLQFDKPAFWNVNDGSDKVSFNGNDVHVLGYLRAYLFDANRARTRTSELSGGERNRLLLARMFAQPSNLLIMDEPTNDLDVETLELLEDLLNNYSGTILLVSHDRSFVNAVVDGMLVHDGEAGFVYAPGNYDDWQREAKTRRKANTEKAATKNSSKSANSPAAKKNTHKKLGYREQRELEQLPAKIEDLESKISAIHAAMADPEFFKRPEAELKASDAELRQLETDLAYAYARWESLESS